MKINEVIQEMDNETILNIGSGSGWFFIGKKEDYEKNIEKISRSYLDNAKEREKKYREKIREANEVLADSKLTFDELNKMIKKNPKILSSTEACGKIHKRIYSNKKT